MNIKTVQKFNDVITKKLDCYKVSLVDDNITVLCVPLDTANRHYQAIQEWVAKGNKIEDAD